MLKGQVTGRDMPPIHRTTKMRSSLLCCQWQPIGVSVGLIPAVDSAGWRRRVQYRCPYSSCRCPGFCNAWFGLSWTTGTFAACAGTFIYSWITKFRSYWYMYPSHKSDNCVVQPHNNNATPSRTFKCYYCIFSMSGDLCTLFWLNVQCSGNCLITLLLVMPLLGPLVPIQEASSS